MLLKNNVLAAVIRRVQALIGITGRKEMNELLNQTEKFDAKVYFLCGDNEGDADVITDMENIEKWVNTKRCECKKLNKKVIVKGGQHNEKLWRESFKKAYLWLF